MTTSTIAKTAYAKNKNGVNLTEPADQSGFFNFLGDDISYILELVLSPWNLRKAHEDASLYFVRVVEPNIQIHW